MFSYSDQNSEGREGLEMKLVLTATIGPWYETFEIFNLNQTVPEDDNKLESLLLCDVMW